MATQPHESAHGKEYLDQPSMDPARHSNDAEHHDEPTAEFPAEAADDMGQLLGEQNGNYPFSEELSEQIGPQGENAAQYGGSGPRIDDLGIADLGDKDALEKQDLPMLDQLARTDKPLFDQSLDNRDPDAPHGAHANQAIQSDPNAESGIEADPDALDEDIKPYDISLDGPGTDDLR